MRKNKPPEYVVWNLMEQRCNNPNRREYKNYGGRGITLCKEWSGRGGFDRFLAHIGPRQDKTLTLDRIDNNKGYEPGNVRWVTRSQNLRNTRITKMVSLWGSKVSLRDIAQVFDIKFETIRHRVFNRCMSWQDAVLMKKWSKPRLADAHEECAA